MPHYGVLRDYAFSEDIDDIRGTELYGTNGDKLGKIDDLVFDHETGDVKYAVVDTGGWLRHKKFLIPADEIHDDPQHNDAFQAALTKARIERFPRYEEKHLESEKNWREYEKQYKEAWEAHPVQHRDDRPDLDVTPATLNTGSSPTGTPSARDIERDLRERNEEEELAEEDREGRFTPERIAGKFPETIQSPDKIHMNPAHVPERTQEQVWVGNQQIPTRAWQDNPTGSGGRRNAPGVGGGLKNEFPVDTNPPENPEQRRERAPRIHRFEDLLRANRVDITAKCSSCAPRKDKNKVA